MGSGHPPFTFNRYFYGEETVADNQMNTIQYYRRVASGRLQDPPPAHPAISNAAPYNPAPSTSFESHRMNNRGSIDGVESGSRSYPLNAQGYGGSPTHINSFGLCRGIDAIRNNIVNSKAQGESSGDVMKKLLERLREIPNARVHVVTNESLELIGQWLSPLRAFGKYGRVFGSLFPTLLSVFFL
ncbi:hypothetical protein Bhyg_07587 [Pseudolycoriella hygida]|uniref:Uncharacterized protein n=1 Tax=Pseudolycoriella hygida TaxID=35572 RepID=A0A9Q0N2Z1_9DIPT|nr:hypothetical protein Bhyg_07587 [Pseudolycoriella hygida]